MDVADDDCLSPQQTKAEPTDNDWKRTKWQPPPSHHSLLPIRSKVVHKASSRNQIMNSDRHRLPQMEDFRNQDEGIEDSEFIAFADRFSHHFSKQNVNNPSFESIADVVSTPKINRLDSMARADMCPIIRRPRLVTMKGVGSRIREQYGYEISNTTYLYAEEALYLVEIGKLQLYLGNINLSVERARSLLLHSKSHPKTKPSKIKSCSVDEYTVYKHLSKLGYRLRRRDQHDIKLECLKDPIVSESSSPGPSGMGTQKDTEMQIDGTDDTMMDLSDEPIRSQIPYDYVSNNNGNSQSFSSPSSGLGNSVSDCLNKRGLKRKFGEFSSSQNAGSTTPSSSAKDISDDEDADVEFDFVPALGDVYMDSVYEMAPSQHVENYMVTEADSDVEILDEVLNSSVKIEEIRYDYDGDIEDDVTIGMEPQPSTSAACFPAQGLVDLAESDSEEEQEIKSFTKVWSKFVPNVTIQIGYPPAVLLPSNIPYRHAIYEFDLKIKGDRFDSELEYYVDELNLNSSPAETENERDCQKHKIKRDQCKSWKSWRQMTIEEARDVLNDSLLARSIDNGEHCDNAMKKLYLWNDKRSSSKPQLGEGWSRFVIPFDLYPPVSGSNVHKNRLKSDFQPCYVVAVVRNYDLVPSFSACEAHLNGVPVLVAAVTGESDILFMTPDRSPVPSLF